MTSDPSNAANPRLPCPQCGAAITLADDQPFRSCEHCSATLFLDLGHFVLHAYVAPRLDVRSAPGALQRFLKSAEITAPVSEVRAELVYLPFAVFARYEGTGSVLLTLLGGRSLPFDARAFSGALEPYDRAKARGTILEPELTLEEGRTLAGAAPEDQGRLVHVPFHQIRYSCAGRSYRAVLSALDGSGHAEVLPPASTASLDRSYAAWAAAATLVFLLEAAALPSASVAMAMMAPTILFFWWFLAGVQRANR